jgi:hypothetical protein
MPDLLMRRAAFRQLHEIWTCRLRLAASKQRAGAIDAAGGGVLLTARAESHIVGHPPARRRPGGGPQSGGGPDFSTGYARGEPGVCAPLGFLALAHRSIEAEEEARCTIRSR